MPLVFNSRSWWRRPLVRPAALKAGDKVAVVSPSWGGPGQFPHRYEAGKAYLQDAFQVQVVETTHALRNPQWVYDNPKARAEDIAEAFSDATVRAVIASIGGDDAVRLIPHLDIGIIADNPKIFLGYSDTTILHFACLKAGLVSFYGPSIMAGFAENGGMHAYTEQHLRKVICCSDPIGEVFSNSQGWTVEHLPWADPFLQERKRALVPTVPPRVLQGQGVVQGHLIGGCAEVLEMLKGSPLWPPLSYWTGSVLFYETSEEAPAPGLVLRWLRNYAAQGILHEISAILLGRPGGQIDFSQHVDYERSVLQVLQEAGLPELPIMTGLDFGHTDPFFTIPYGVTAKIDCQKAKLHIVEAGVS